MTRKLLFALLLLFVPVILGAQTLDRDALLTPNGTMYTVGSVLNNEGKIDSPSSRVLQLTVQNGDTTETAYVPATLTGGSHSDPSLAYDRESDTLFVFWQKTPNAMSSELLFSSYNNGTWSPATSIDRASFNIRFGLQIAVTKFAYVFDENDERKKIDAISIHAIWWEQTGYGEEARYALLTLDEGTVVGIELRSLMQFVDSRRISGVEELPANFDRDFFRHPGIFENSSHDSVDIIFADWETNRMHRIGITPITAQGVIRIPDGVWQGEIAPPQSQIVTSSMTMVSGSNGTFGIYGRDASSISYLIYKNGAWSTARTIKTNQVVTPETAIEAFRKLVSSE